MLSFSLSYAELSVEHSTKVISTEELNAFTVSIPNSGFVTDTYGNIAGKEISLEIGDYTAYAESCTEEASQTGYGCFRYSGSKDFTIAAGVKSDVSIPCAVSNSKISVMLSPEFIGFFDIGETSVSVSTSFDGVTRPLTFGNFYVMDDSEGSAVAMTDATHSASQYAYYLPDEILYFTIHTRRASAEDVNTFTTGPVTTSAKTWHKISVDLDLSTDGIVVKTGSASSDIHNGFSIDGYTSGTVTED